jgi:hypothetical protein
VAVGSTSDNLRIAGVVVSRLHRNASTIGRKYDARIARSADRDSVTRMM